PFIDNQLHPMLRILFCHDLPVAVDQLLHAIAFAHEFVPVHSLKVEGIAFALNPVLRLAAAQVPSVVMKCPSVKGMQLPTPLASHLFEEAPGPSPVIHVRPGTN